MPDFVRLVNENDTDFDFHQSNAKRIIPPGGDAIVPWNIAVSLFGHPNIPDVPPANERSKMYEKIRARHNYSAGLQTEVEWQQIKPKVRVFDIENNDTEVIMLIDDPAGDHMGNAPVRKPLGKQTDIESLQAQVASLTGQIQKLVTSQQASPAENAAGTTSSPTAVSDGPAADGVDSVFNIPTSDETATQDSPQAVTTGDIPTADDDTPPVAKKVAAKKVAAKKTAAK